MAQTQTINISNLKEIPTIPIVVTRAIQIMNNPHSSVNELTELITKDQVLAAKILKVANSAYYGLPSKVTNLNRAITLIGFNEVRRLITPILLLDAFKSFKDNKYFSSKKFWSHSLAVAEACEILAEKANLTHDIGKARVVGLLHDVGRLIIIETSPDKFETVMKKVELGVSILKAEKAILGIDHAEIGAKVAKMWNLPEIIVQIIAYHHRPLQATEECAVFAEITCMADYLAYELDLKSLLKGDPPLLPDKVKNRFIREKEDLDILLTRLETQIEKTQHILSLIRE